MKHENLFVDYKFPEPLSDEEIKYYMKEIENGNQQARKTVIEHNIRLVLNQVLKKFTNVPVEKQELVSVGLIGLIKAVNTFDYTKNFKFSTYAFRCIDNEILMYINKNKKNFNTISLDSSEFDDDSINTTKEDSLKDVLVDESVDIIYDYERKELIEGIKSSLNLLTDLERKCVMLYFGFINNKEYKQYEIAKIVNMTQSYVCRVLNRGIRKIAQVLKDEKLIDGLYYSKIKLKK